MNIPLPKLKAIILYFCSNTERRFLGKTKLMKLFYFLDFIHLKRFGSPVTGDKYVHLEYGPIPAVIKNLVDNAAGDPDSALLADTISVERSDGTDIHKIVATRSFSENDKKYFSETELRVLEEVCARFGDKNTEFIKNAAHKEAPWLKTAMLEEIPFSLAAEDSDCQVSKEEIELLKIFS